VYLKWIVTDEDSRRRRRAASGKSTDPSPAK